MCAYFDIWIIIITVIIVIIIFFIIIFRKMLFALNPFLHEPMVTLFLEGHQKVK